jgi:predicted nucleotidyltransferase
MSKDAAAVQPNEDPVLKRFRAALDELYGDRLERVVLYGSRARGDAHPGSDYDVAVFLRDFCDRWSEMDRIIPVVTDILYQDEAFIH